MRDVHVARLLELGARHVDREHLDRLLKGLRRTFPNGTTFRVDVERERCVFVHGGDSREWDRMRAFCAGFVAAIE